MSPRPIVEALIALVVAAGANAARGQGGDVPPPPRLDIEARAEARGGISTLARVPDGARLAPLPAEREPRAAQTPIDEIVVIGDTEWRLPDLGSSWRAEQEAEENDGRVSVDFLPLYDPESPPEPKNPFILSREAQRLGFIELFRVRFGRPTTE